MKTVCEKYWKHDMPDSYKFEVNWKHYFRITRMKTTFLKRVIQYGEIKKGTRVLDIGAGGGTDSMPLALMGAEVTALEYNKSIACNLVDYIEAMRKYTGKKPSIKVIVDDFMDANLKKGYYDVVISNGVLEHYLNEDERKDFIKKLFYVTKKGGYIITGVPNGKHPYRKLFREKEYGGNNKSLPELNYDKELFEEYFGKCMVDGIYLFMWVFSFPVLLSPLKYLILPFYTIIRLYESCFPRWFRRKYGFWLLCVVRK